MGMTILNLGDDMQEEQWKEEMLCFFRGEDYQEDLYLDINIGEKKNIDREEKCSWCVGEKGCRLEQYYAVGRIRDECYKTRISTGAEATGIVWQCFKNLYSMYGVSKWKGIKVKLKSNKLINHQFQWYEGAVVYKRTRMKKKKDNLYVAKKIPVEMAEAAIVKVLLEQYMGMQSLSLAGNDKKPDVEMEESKKYVGFAIWCTIHYLYIVKGGDWAKRYEADLLGEGAESYKKCCELLGGALDGRRVRIEEIILRVKNL